MRGNALRGEARDGARDPGASAVFLTMEHRSILRCVFPQSQLTETGYPTGSHFRRRLGAPCGSLLRGFWSEAGAWRSPRGDAFDRLRRAGPARSGQPDPGREPGGTTAVRGSHHRGVAAAAGTAHQPPGIEGRGLPQRAVAPPELAARAASHESLRSEGRHALAVFRAPAAARERADPGPVPRACDVHPSRGEDRRLAKRSCVAAILSLRPGRGVRGGNRR